LAEVERVGALRERQLECRLDNKFFYIEMRSTGEQSYNGAT